MTAEELTRLSIPDRQVELVRGRIEVREPPGTWHGALSGRLFQTIAEHVRSRGLGLVFPQDTGFHIASDPDTVRAPDVAFVRADRTREIPREGYAALAPDLVIEVVSSSDRTGAVLGKVAEWLEAGARLVWVLDPRRGEARVHRADGSLEILDRADELDGEDVVPGFRCPVGPLFD